MSARTRMHAILLDHSAPGGFALHEVDRPYPGPHEALVRVAAISISGEEVAEAWRSGSYGATLGSNLAGTVETRAADGSGPSAGARVAGLVHSGAWAEFVAVPSGALAELPGKVSFAQAAALPTAGLTAFYGLQYGGLLVAKRVLIMCGTGGVGLCAVQLARLSGAWVTATIPEPENEALMEEYGADHVVVGDIAAARPFGPYDLVVAETGESMLEPALRLMRAGSTCVLCTLAENHATVIDGEVFTKWGTRLQGVRLSEEMRREPASGTLQRLLALVETYALQPHVELEAGWTEVGSVSQRLVDRRFVGRAVLHL